ncbi:hybrid sensor histidine kinase/response regulator [Microscilla marina]|uniref:histidine kinase n=1 Tax=Microscilla marina ATCC 23134 TaxID=313606 RepID=A1ZW38_MICM2|nr:hybrid sensor histidine kinase/response regulator [Microscilla marina]EAY25401.1 two-component system sensor histidine kinase [Microscilla marina ATCC 23134]
MPENQLPQATILIVDDQSENIQTITHFLEEAQQGYELLIASNGKIAFEVAKKTLPDLIITDWDMPFMNGLELTQAVKTNASTQHIPILLITGVYTSSEDLKTALDAGAHDYLRKPIQKVELWARASSVLKLMQSYSTIQTQATEIERQNEELLAQNKQLEELIATKDKFFSIIGHDLSSPISQMIGFTDMLENHIEAFTTEEIVQFVARLKESSMQGFRLLDNLLRWSQTQTGSISFNPAVCSLNELIQNNIDLHKEKAQDKEVSFELRVKEVHHLVLDSDMIDTVLRNLVSNAIKFTSKGGTITITVTTGVQEATVSVKDTGMGISATNIAKLFRPDVHYSTSGTQNEKGTGLGLILCREFVEVHGGKIWAESTEGAGSVFKFTIPIK